MKNKLLHRDIKINSEQEKNLSTINIENSEALDIFGVNNENVYFFEKILSLKIFQKGNQLNVQGSKKKY